MVFFDFYSEINIQHFVFVLLLQVTEKFYHNFDQKVFHVILYQKFGTKEEMILLSGSKLMILKMKKKDKKKLSYGRGLNPRPPALMSDTLPQNQCRHLKCWWNFLIEEFKTLDLVLGWRLKMIRKKWYSLGLLRIFKNNYALSKIRKQFTLQYFFTNF